jgi:hypothetical protein
VRPEVRFTLEIYGLVIQGDGTTAEVKGVAATVVIGRLGHVVYTVEKNSGAWSDLARAHARLPGSGCRRTRHREMIWILSLPPTFIA